MAMNIRLGVDVGGTNTDAVLLDEKGNLLAKAKCATTLDVTEGIRCAIARVLEDTTIAPERISHAMLGTTHCTNAIVERKGLTPLAVLRIGAPASLAVPPFADWPEDLVHALKPKTTIVRGGYEFDGREIVPLGEEEIVAFLKTLPSNLRAIAIVGIFSPVSDRQEKRAEELVREVLGPAIAVSCSNEIGSVGLLERENATILNAALTDVARRATQAFTEALQSHGIHAQEFFAQNDGTLMQLNYALRYPILTIASGPTNSLRGAAYLTGLKEAIVIDVGGTTSDLGVLQHGFPRESSAAVEIGGVRTNFRMPDLLSIGLGGGTIVRYEDGHQVTLGPDSVGYRLSTEAYIFGGSTLTLSDVAVRAGLMKLGTTPPPQLKDELQAAVMAEITRKLADAVDRLKTSPTEVTVIAVGGGAFLVPTELPGVKEVLRPDHNDVANAIGAAIAQVSGEVDKLFSLEGKSREAVLQEAKDQAIHSAVLAGAAVDHVEIIDVEEIPLAYLPGNAIRIRVKAAGPLHVKEATS